MVEERTEEKEQEQESERLLTVAEFASQVGKTERQVYRYIKTGRVQGLPPEKTGLPGVRLSSTELEKFLSENSNSGSGCFARVRSASSGVGSSFESFEDSVEGMTTAVESSEEEPAAQPLTVPLERHEAAVMRLGYLQSQYELSQRLLTEGSSKEKQLNQKIDELQEELHSAQARAQRAEELEEALKRSQARQEELEKAKSDNTAQLEARVKELEASLEQAEEKIMRSEVKAQVESENRADTEGRLRQMTIRLQEAERAASRSWWQRLFVAE